MVLERCKQRLELLFQKLLVDNEAAALEAYTPQRLSCGSVVRLLKK